MSSDLRNTVLELSPEQRALLELRLQKKRAATRRTPAIPRRGDVSALPLSFAQQRLWFLEQLAPGSPLYIMPVAVRLSGGLSVPALAWSLREIVRRHEALRTWFVSLEGRPLQVHAQLSATGLPVVDLRALPASRRDAESLRLAAAEAARPFDLSRDDLLRALLVRLGEGEHLLLLTLHHIVSDGWSLGVVLQELGALYRNDLHGGRGLPELPIQYADFAAWQQEWLTGDVLESQLSYWRGRLAGAPAILDLPTDRPRPANQAFRGATEAVDLGELLTQDLKAFAQRHDATLFMALVAGFGLLLARYSGHDDLLVGTPIANRTRLETEGLIGLFVNTLVLRADLAGEPNAVAALARVRETTLGAFAHQDLPFEKLVEELAPERNLSHSPLFQVMFALQNTPLPELRLPGLEMRPAAVGNPTAKFDLSLTFEERDGALSGVFEYGSDLYEAATVRRMGGHLRNLLAGLVDLPEAAVWHLPMLGSAERQQLLAEWNDTAAAYPAGVCLHGLFVAQAARTPDAVAVVYEDETLTYAGLDLWSDRLARHLRRLGVGPDVPVVLCVERSLEMVAGLLGVLKAGGAYLPLDPAYPEERRAYMLEHSGAPVVLTRESLLASLARGEEAGDAGPLEAAPAPLNLAYVLYTSGSTGRPKGVMISHAAIVNHMFWMQAVRPLGAGDAVLQKTPFSFDASVWEFWAPLLAGATLVMARPGGHQEPAYLADRIARHGVTTFQVVPTLLKLFLQEPGAAACASLARLYCGGEALPLELAERCFEVLPDVELLNVYGPTEASIHASFWGSRQGAPERAVPIGRPIGNGQVHLLDRALQPVPVGVPGLLYVGGAGLGRGYYRRPELTAERFIPNPLSSEPGARLYSTGDLARLLPDGNIEFLGRVDHQVKVRGFRIELGEIEAVLADHPGVREAVVVARQEDPGAQRLAAYLVAYLVAAAGGGPALSELRAHLKASLPEYMVPTDFVLLERLPLMPNGKLDRSALPAPERPAARPDEPAAAPLSPVEELLATVWAGILGLPRVGAGDDFFELGGHSLLATRVMSRVRETFGVELPLRSLFEASTVAGLARRIEAARQSERGLAAPPIVPVRRPEEAPLSFAQERLWFLDQMEPGNPAYNLAAAVRFQGALDLTSLARALAGAARRHEALRTRFPLIDGRPVQAIDPPCPCALPVIDLAGLPIGIGERRAALLGLLSEEARRPFDLARGPLWRAMALRLDTHDHVLSLTLHHTVSDGWSTGILVREVAELYEALSAGRPSPLPELPIQFSDFAWWQREWLRGRVLDGQLAYWRERLAGAPAVLSLPTDRPRPAAQSYRGSHLPLVLPRELSAGAVALGRREGVTTYMVLLAAFAVLLQRWSGQEDLTVGTPVAGRDRSEIEGLIGCFINMLPLRVELADDPVVSELLVRVREVALGGYAHQDTPFEQIVEALGLRRDLSHSPVFQVMFSWQNVPVAPLSLPGLDLEPIAVEGSGSRFDLTLELAESAQGLAGGIEYSTDLFDGSTMARLAGHFEVLLGGLVTGSGRPLSELPLLSPAESQQLLREWNDTGLPEPAKLTIPYLIELRAAATPEEVAILFRDERLTYRQLNGRANQLAHHLRAMGVGPEDVVGLCAERSAEMVVALLAILKTGAAYLPLDPSYPTERLSFMLEDCRVPVLLTQERLAGRFPSFAGPCFHLDAYWQAVAGRSTADLPNRPQADNVAYVIYTSGSTGRPKGVMVSHRNVINFFSGMDARIGGAAPGTWLAVTSISFDISVLEIFWTLSRGFRVVVQEDPAAFRATAPEAPARPLAFSLFYFASDSSGDEDGPAADRYRLLLDGARFADRHGFSAVWTPERHFHAFGGLYPNPSVTSAALATITERIEIRAGSVVLPLHNPIRVAEEWSVVDNLSRGRVGISFAPGWHAGDFVLAPESFDRRKELMFEGIETVRRLWRGEAVTCRGVGGTETAVSIRPRPVRRELPVWVTAAGNPDTFRAAGEIGANVLTHLLGQTVEEVGAMIALYRDAWRSCGHAGEGHVTVMLHTFVGEDLERVRETVRRPFRSYLASSVGLLKSLGQALGRDMSSAAFTPDDFETLLDHAFDRYFTTSSLFGTPDVCLAMIDRLRALGVDEVGCLIDFGVDPDTVLDSLRLLDQVRQRAGARAGQSAGEDYSLPAQIARHGVTHLQCTPSLARMLSLDPASLQALGSLRRLLLGGEALPASLAARLGEAVQGEIHNMYGPTETTIWSATQRVDAGAPISIGRPIANTSIHILDRGGRPMPAGVPGELLIGGDGVVRGYLHRPELTAQRFVPDPFGRPGARLYRTGDLARRLADGRIEFLGRTDHQVKIRGFRIELGEIEAALARHPAVRAAVVAVREDAAGEARLVAYFVPSRPGATPAGNELRRSLAATLPESMVPAAVVPLDALPLTPNGKVDRAALPAPEASRPDPEREIVTARSPVQEMLAAVWAEVLGLGQVGIHDDFFDLGGHSLLATQLVSRLREAFQVALPLRAVFEAPSVALLAQRIEAAQLEEQGIHMPPLERVERGGDHPLSFAQQRIWVLDQLTPGSAAYNDRAAVTLEGALDLTALARSLCEIVRRHESLRTHFALVDGRAVQRVSAVPAAALTALPVVDLRALPEATRRAALPELSREFAQRSFDLTSGPLLRFALLRVTGDEHVLAFAVHHIVWDGWSFGVFLRELLSLYRAFSQGEPSPLAELPVHYVDFAHWQRRWLTGEPLENQLDYWKKRLGTGVPTCQLPADRPRSAARGNRGTRLLRDLPPGLSAELRALSRREGVTLFMTLMAGFKTLMGHAMRGHDIVVGTDVANRNRIETETMIGFFVNQLVLRTDLSGDPTFREVLGRVREVALGAYAHQDVSFDRLVDALQWDRRPGQTPLFQVKFVLQNAPVPDQELPGLALRPLEVGWETAKFELLLNMVDSGEQIAGSWEYSTELFDEASIAALAARLEVLLESAAARPEARLSELFAVLADRERQHRAQRKSERARGHLAKLATVKRRVFAAGTAVAEAGDE